MRNKPEEFSQQSESVQAERVVFDSTQVISPSLCSLQNHKHIFRNWSFKN
jgi:hypothetical protein